MDVKPIPKQTRKMLLKSILTNETKVVEYESPQIITNDPQLVITPDMFKPPEVKSKREYERATIEVVNNE